ncbi:MAG: hypothetical protein SW127_18400 [Actinomycetota bacterium]|nr:hypothetical protein [Actinomycetota bacterium]
MDVYCPTADSDFAYPDVMPGATAFVVSEDKPTQDTVLVTAYGLRRLLRFVANVQPLLIQTAVPDMAECYRDALTPEKIRTMLNESCKIWCEGDLVMSRLFVTTDGKAVIAHKDPEVDAAGIPPWEQDVTALRKE